MTAREEAQAASATFGSVVLTVVGTDGYPLSLRCRLTPAGDKAALQVPQPDWLKFEDGPACLMSHSHNDVGWDLRSFLAKGSAALREGHVVFTPAEFRWLAATGGSRIALFRSALKQILQARRDAERYLLRADETPPAIPWKTLRGAKKRVLAEGRRAEGQHS
ncbi:hypothetical protein [Kribbella sp. NPDC023855]|uniref:hypothetical protein n=1 Tax=Kribbella sp. NPDC023855 TaxID=3154698 RepID=UPI00340B6719